MMTEHCRMTHRRPVMAVEIHEGSPLCQRHLNRALQDERIRSYLPVAPRCPDHPETMPKVTRWHGQSRPRLFCPTGLGDQINTRPSGRSAFRMTSARTYLQWCPWQAEIPPEILNG